MHIRIATRTSPLALWQAQFVADCITRAYPQHTVTYVPCITEGDKRLDMELAAIGGKGLFITALEEAMSEKKADIAVHSLKDLPTTLDPSFCLAAICEREDPRDVLVSPVAQTIAQLPKNAVIGSSSLRRSAIMRRIRPDLNIQPIRGNIATRLAKLDSGAYDALLLAAAGLIRLKEHDRISSFLPTDLCVPAAGQGAIAVACRATDTAIQTCITTAAHHNATALCTTAERTMSDALGGSCHTPIGAFACFTEQTMQLTGTVVAPDGRHHCTATETNDVRTEDAAVRLGIQVAEQLCAQGARAIIATL